MRALCGALLTAVALIGMGLSAASVGGPPDEMPLADRDTNPPAPVQFGRGNVLLLAEVLFAILLVIGFALTFIGLAHHHHRRDREFLHEHGYLPLPTLTGPGRRIVAVRPPPEPPPNVPPA